MKKFALMAAALLMWGAAFAQQHVKVQGPMGQLDTEIMKPEQLKPGQKCAAVILMHGFTGRKESPLFDEIAKGLLAKNVAVIRFDFNGHGQSEGDFKNMTVPNEIEDAKAVVKYVEGLDFVQNIALLGHSQGGVVASMTAGELGAGKIRKVVLMAPAAVLREDALRGSTMGKQYDPRNPGDVKMFGDKVLGENYIRTAQTLPIFKTAGQYIGPVMMIHGTYDVVVPCTFSEYYSYVYKNSKLQFIDGADHGFSKHIPEAATFAVDFLTKF